jgi:hypothetical protein
MVRTSNASGAITVAAFIIVSLTMPEVVVALYGSVMVVALARLAWRRSPMENLLQEIFGQPPADYSEAISHLKRRVSETEGATRNQLNAILTKLQSMQKVTSKHEDFISAIKRGMEDGPHGPSDMPTAAKPAASNGHAHAASPEHAQA